MPQDVARRQIAAPHKRFGRGFIDALAASARLAFSFARCTPAQQIGLRALFIRQRQFLRERVEVRAARFGKQIFAVMPHFDVGRKHRAKRFADRRNVVAADPLA